MPAFDGSRLSLYEVDVRATSFLLWSSLAFACSSAPPTAEDGTPIGGQPSHASGTLGAPCANDVDCKSGLCLQEAVPLFGKGGPPGGICSSSCQDDRPCPSGSVCTTTAAGERCLLACDFGNDPQKCGNRVEYACEPLLLPSMTSCALDSQCGVDQLCFQRDGDAGLCETVLGICTPRCAVDADCTGGRFCERSSGECVTEKPRGKSFGAACDLDKDDCGGKCVEVSPGMGECEERCRIGAKSGCGEATIGTSDVICGFFAYDLGALGVDQGSGDTGVCATLCQCSDDCSGTQRCLNNPIGKNAGLCAGGVDIADSVTCSGGVGGGGGAEP